MGKIRHSGAALETKVRMGLRTVALLSASAGLMGVCLAGPGEKVEFSDTGSSAPSTNKISVRLGADLSHLNNNPGALRQIQDDIFSPLAPPLDPLDSMQGVFSTPPDQQNQQQPTPAEARRAKRQSDKRKNWAFANMNVLDGTSSGETDPEEDQDSISLDGHDKNSDSVIEEFVNGKSGKGATNQVQIIQWYTSAGQERENSFSASGGNRQNGPHASWVQAPTRDFFGDDQGADHASGDTFGFHGEVSAARAAADFSALTRQRDAFREVLDAPAGGNAAGGSGVFGSRSSAASLFSAPNPAAASFSAPHSSLFGSGDTSYGAAYKPRTYETAVPAGPAGPLGNAATSPAAVQQLLDPYSSVMKRPPL